MNHLLPLFLYTINSRQASTEEENFVKYSIHYPNLCGVDYVSLRFVFEGNITSQQFQAMDHLIYANFNHSNFMDSTWEVNNEIMLSVDGVRIAEAFYCKPINGSVLEVNEQN